MRWWFIGLSGLLQGIAAIVSWLVLYEGLIVPLLPTVNAVPYWWWFLQTSPVWGTGILLGWFAQSSRELFAASLAGALGSQVYLDWASTTQRPGFVNQPLAETDPAVFWTLGSLFTWMALCVPYLAGLGLRRLVRLHFLAPEEAE